MQGLFCKNFARFLPQETRVPPSGRVEVPTVQMTVLSLSRDGGGRCGCIGIDKEGPRCGPMILIVRRTRLARPYTYGLSRLDEGEEIT